MPDEPQEAQERDDTLKQPDEKVKDLDVDEENEKKVEGGFSKIEYDFK